MRSKNIQRKLLPNSATTALQTLNYTYNIRSWLTNINDVSALGEDSVALTKKINIKCAR